MALPEVDQVMSVWPPHVLEDILERLEDAPDIVTAQLVCKEFWAAGNHVRSLRLGVLDEYHERARDKLNIAKRSGLRSPISGEGLVADGGGSTSVAGSSQADVGDGRFKTQMVKTLEKKNDLVQLRVEIESKLQAKTVPEDERRRTDFWISDPCFLRQWLPGMGSTLQHLSIADYGEQAIMRRSSIIKILSQSCKRLKTLDLRNMFIDMSDCDQMRLMASLTLCSVKVTGAALQDINDIMPKLHTLALRGVFGLKRGNLTCQEMKVLYLGLSTPASDVEADLPKLEKLQFKMQCPQKLIIRAPALKYVAFNLDVLGSSKWELKYDDGLIQLVYGASSFITLSSISEKNPNLERNFFDVPCVAQTLEIGRSCVDETLEIPCMALLRDGRYLDLLNDTPVNLPSFSRLHECGNLEMPTNASTGVWNQWKREIPDGLNLQMNASTV